MNTDINKEDKKTLLVRSPPKNKVTAKSIAFVVIGALTLVYVFVEIGAALYIGSLTLLSDGFHNLSDVVSLYIAWWADKASKREISDEFSYGWARTEILGGLTNGCFLVSLCMYVLLEAIPKFIKPVAIEGGFIFMMVAGTGLLLNTVGTIVFAATGMSHGHSHAGGESHGHSHEHKKKKKKIKHSHSHKKDDKEDNVEEGLLSEHEEENEHKKDKKKDKHDYGVDEHEHEHDHGHSHKHKKKNKSKLSMANFDVNMWGVFLHFLGDAISSLFVLVTGALIHFFNGAFWIPYIDPVSSVLIVLLIVVTTVPLIKRCSLILLHKVPHNVEIATIRSKIGNLEHVISMHDLHVWQLVDKMTIASVHLIVEEGTDLTEISAKVRLIFHESGVHSTTIQPEFPLSPSLLGKSPPANNIPKDGTPFCLQNCIDECQEDWCCRRTSDRLENFELEFSTQLNLI